MEEEFQKVQGEVEKITGGKKQSSVSSSETTDTSKDRIKFDSNKVRVYGIITGAVLLLLTCIRPSFLYVETKNKLEKEFSFFRLAIFTCILSVLVIVFYEFLEKRKFLKP